MSRDHLRFGIATLGNPPEEIVELAKHAEVLGFDRVLYGDHLLLPTALDAEAYPYERGSPLPATVEYGDPVVVASAVLTAAPRMEFLTGVYLLPMHHPLLAARAAMTMQKLSGSRLLLGVGAGWMYEEFDAVGVSFGRRGRWFDEALEIVRAACLGQPFSYEGEFFAFPEVLISGRPTIVPLIVGGSSPRALRRAAAYGDGWYSTPDLDVDLDVDECIRARATIEAHRRVDPTPEIGRI
jgi:probable F420-dependent oxidoreductase